MKKDRVKDSTSIVVIAGPTASGKSALALQLAQRLDGEIINADSQQVYLGLDIGTAKPGPAERQALPHHLLDIATVGEQLTAARFTNLADNAIEGIISREALPLVVGGSGLWLRALLRGLADAPAADSALRKSLEEEGFRDGPGSLHERLKAVDPVSAARLHPNDHVRVIRAIEVFQLTGKPLSEHHSEHGFREERYSHILFALRPNMVELKKRIRARTETMLCSGWVEEVNNLLEAGVSRDRLKRVLGYNEVAGYLAGESGLDALVDTIVAKTWRYAKRQLMWLRKEEGVQWIEPPADVDLLCAQLSAWK